MNFLCLKLVNAFYHGTATLGRMLLGALLGSLCFLLVFVLPGGYVLKLLISSVLAALGMLLISFRPRSMRGLFRMLETLGVMTMLLMTLVILAERLLQPLVKNCDGLWWWLFIAIMTFEVLVRRVRKIHKMETTCKVVLQTKHTRLKVNALVDTGNSLVEPISGKPVSLLEKNVFDTLFALENPGLFRVIPYHSVGREKGILQGFLLPRMEVEWEGIHKEFQNVYIGVCPELFYQKGPYRMILNPKMLEG